MLDRLQKAMEGLTTLVDRVTQGELSDGEGLRTEMLRWEREDAGGSGGMAELAIHALTLQLAERGVRGSVKESAEKIRTLQRLKSALFPPYTLRPVEVDPAPVFRERFPDARAYRIREVQIIAEPENGSWHVSVSHPERLPAWEELQAAAGLADGVEAMWARVPATREPGSSPASSVVHLYEDPRAAP